MNELESMTLLDHISGIITLSRQRGTGADFFTSAAPHLEAVSATLGLSAGEALIFSYFLNEFGDESATLTDVAKSLKWENIEMLRRMRDVENLENKKFIRRRDPRRISGRRSRLRSYLSTREAVTYYVPMEVLNAVTRGEAFTPRGYENLSAGGIFLNLEAFFEQLETNEIGYEGFITEINAMFNANRDIDFVKKTLALNLDEKDMVLLLLFCHRMINNDEDSLKYSDLDDIFDGRYTVNRVVRTLKNLTNPLIENGLIESMNEDGFGSRELWTLTDKAKTTILSELDLSEKPLKKRNPLSAAADIPEKQLFFNKREKEKIEKLRSLLGPDEFTLVEERLGRHGLRPGFACLFYGPPGTGKTESALQLARETGRDIMRVNIADIKSKWFGESEKQIKNLFCRYRACVDEYRKENAPVPILLFNEADAVISKRRALHETRTGPDQTENALQNILLEEIENLSGIIIATTNLTKNMDSAFERRFLYKIEFNLPEKETRAKIWKNQIPSISEPDAFVLAERYRFSGGQIENISRKFIVDLVLEGIDIDLKRMIQYCDDEIPEKTVKPLGFTA